MVEAALVLPIVFLMLFALIDGAMFFKDDLTARNAARDGAWAGAQEGQSTMADYRILQLVKKRSLAMGEGSVERVIVYKATSADAKPSPSCIAGTADSTCNVYEVAEGDLDKPREAFGNAAGGWGKDLYWPGSSRQTQRSAGTDLLGVYIKARASTPTGILGGDNQEIERFAVIRLEARTY